MYKARVLVVAALATVAGCGGGGGDGGGGTGPAVFTSLSVTPATVGLLVNGTQTLTATAKDQNGGSMSGLAVQYTSGNQAVATVTAAGVVTGVAVGATSITASGTVGSVTKTATVSVTVAAPSPSASVDATVQNTFNPATAFITRNGTVTWNFATLHNVIFDGSGGPTNINDTASGSVSRTFPTAGTFNYHCTIHPGMNGAVVVQ
jgi:plastocyanin